MGSFVLGVLEPLYHLSKAHYKACLCFILHLSKREFNIDTASVNLY